MYNWLVVLVWKTTQVTRFYEDGVQERRDSCGSHDVEGDASWAKRIQVPQELLFLVSAEKESAL